MIRQKFAGFLMAASLLGMTTMTACLKTSNSSTQTTWAYSTVINAYPDTVGVNINDGSTLLDTTRFKFRDWTVLRDVPGIHNYNFTTYQTSTQVAGLVAASFDSLSYHTIILYGVGKIANLSENFDGTTADSANIRFYHLSDTTAPVDVYINNQIVFSQVSYTPSTGFFQTWTKFPASSNANLQVKLHSNDSVIVTRTIDLVQANAYQLYLNGYLHGVGSQKIYVNLASYATSY
ncbi:protein of unknown function [Chitinophaga costaii]|uniref:DUF4397 domain-containing protein n=1 Tax=Chitinophaga costaii TaxID=1335309 RepID=A0A1C4E7M8_9BACT|nr:DUF4397 domain-containing protein [Chitinophaga costaii]PUZ24274.1 DUF4397 domain-containing protein [Chitinophaga costaii]SCC39472.1 protein of unknown function [Chitinophaga costaii]